MLTLNEAKTSAETAGVAGICLYARGNVWFARAYYKRTGQLLEASATDAEDAINGLVLAISTLPPIISARRDVTNLLEELGL